MGIGTSHVFVQKRVTNVQVQERESKARDLIKSWGLNPPSYMYGGQKSGYKTRRHLPPILCSLAVQDIDGQEDDEFKKEVPTNKGESDQIFNQAYECLLESLPLNFMLCYSSVFSDFLRGKNLAPRQIKYIEDYIYQNEVLKDAESYK